MKVREEEFVSMVIEQVKHISLSQAQIFIAAILTSRKICCGRDSITYNFSLKIQQQHNFKENQNAVIV